jgi:hypothetical protein
MKSIHQTAQVRTAENGHFYENKRWKAFAIELFPSSF